jgi:ATP synthase F1 delta subunit
LKTDRKKLKRFARWLYDAAGVDGAPGVIHELRSLEALLKTEKQIASVFTNPRFKTSDRAECIAAISENRGLSELTIKFIALLVHAGSLKGLSAIIEILDAMYMTGKNRIKAVVATPSELDKAAEEQLVYCLKTRFQKDIVIESVIDPSLIGGLCVRVGTTVYDTSVRSRLELLRKELLKEGAAPGIEGGASTGVKG